MRGWVGWAILGGIVVLVVGLVVLRGCDREVFPTIEPDTLADTLMTVEKPKPPKTLPERLVRHTVPPRVQVSRGAPDTLLVRRFVAMAHIADSLRHSYNHLRDSLAQAGAPIPPPPVLPAILPSMGGKYTDDKLQLWFTRSDGSILRATAKLRPNFGFAAGVDLQTEKVPAMWEDRAWVRTIRQVKKCAPPTAVMAGVGALVNSSQDWLLGAAIGGGATLVGCLAG